MVGFGWVVGLGGFGGWWILVFFWVVGFGFFGLWNLDKWVVGFGNQPEEVFPMKRVSKCVKRRDK